MPLVAYYDPNKVPAPRGPHNPYAPLRIRRIGTWSPRERKRRLLRATWARHGGPGTKGGYSAALSLSLVAQAWALLHIAGLDPWTRPRRDRWQVCLLGFRLHYQRSYGGWQT